jgi:hypothetical protein
MKQGIGILCRLKLEFYVLASRWRVARYRARVRKAIGNGPFDLRKLSPEDQAFYVKAEFHKATYKRV